MQTDKTGDRNKGNRIMKHTFSGKENKQEDHDGPISLT